MASLPSYFIILAGISLHILYHQQSHLAQVSSGRAMLNPVLRLLVNTTAIIGIIALLGLSIYFGFKFGWITALKFVGLAILVQFVVSMIVFSSGFHRYAWAISLSGIILLPLFIGTMTYVSFCGHSN